MTEPSPPTDIMVIIAHPDDELLCAGLISHHRRQGRSVIIVVVTAGEGGPPAWDADMDPQVIVSLRHDEMVKSAEVLGARHVEFLNFADTYDQSVIDRNSEAIALRIEQVLVQFSPRIVLTHGPDGEYGHPQHIDVNQGVTKAFKKLDPTKIPLLYFCNAFHRENPLPRSNRSINANFVFPVTGRNFQTRDQVMRCHVTQMQCFLGYFGRDMALECYHRVGDSNADAAWFEVVPD